MLTQVSTAGSLPQPCWRNTVIALNQRDELDESAFKIDGVAIAVQKWMPAESLPYTLIQREKTSRFPCMTNVVNLTIKEALEGKRVSRTKGDKYFRYTEAISTDGKPSCLTGQSLESDIALK